MIRIQQHPIDATEVQASVEDVDSGAIVVFLGTTRRTTSGKVTLSLEYDCYEPMARRELESLRSESFKQWPIKKCSIVHRVGVVACGEASVIVAVSSPHRVDAFSAAQWLMDQIKLTVPIWKKEHWEDGTMEWVHPGAESN